MYRKVAGNKLDLKLQYYFFFTAIIIYSIAAFFSVGYFHEDEHYQIIEFAGILNGKNGPDDLTWEYKEKIRSAIQPALAYWIFEGCDVLRISNPYTKAFILRLMTGLFALCAIFYFSESCRKIVPKEYWKHFLVLTYFLWFLPFLNVRFSSETYSGIFLLLAVSFVIREYNKHASYLIIGGLLGLSFLFRFQIAFAVLGLILWLLIVRKERIAKIALLTVAFFFVFIIGIAIDSWFYGELTITLKNYFVTNLIEGKAASYGTSPWYYYFFLVFRYSFFPLGTVILMSFLVVVMKRFKSLVVWIVLPFFLGHSLISHKEFRFLFPLVNFVPILIIMSFDAVSIPKWNSLSRNLIRTFIILVFSINVLCLVIVCIKPAGIGPTKITERISQINNKVRLEIVYAPNCNPYSPWGLTTNFYNEKNATYFELSSYRSGENKLPLTDTRTVLVFSQADINNEQVLRIIRDSGMKELCRSFPDFVVYFLKIYGYGVNNALIVYSN